MKSNIGTDDNDDCIIINDNGDAMQIKSNIGNDDNDDCFIINDNDVENKRDDDDGDVKIIKNNIGNDDNDECIIINDNDETRKDDDGDAKFTYGKVRTLSISNRINNIEFGYEKIGNLTCPIANCKLYKKHIGPMNHVLVVY